MEKRWKARKWKKVNKIKKGKKERSGKDRWKDRK